MKKAPVKKCTLMLSSCPANWRVVTKPNDIPMARTYVRTVKETAPAAILPRYPRGACLMRFVSLADWYLSFGQAFREVVDVVQFGSWDFRGGSGHLLQLYSLVEDEFYPRDFGFVDGFSYLAEEPDVNFSYA